MSELTNHPASIGSRRQFSTRSLLILTAIASLFLAFAVKLPEVFKFALVGLAVALVIVATLKSAFIVTSDRRPRVALLSWTILLALFAIFSTGLFHLVLRTKGKDDLWVLYLAVLAFMIIC